MFGIAWFACTVLIRDNMSLVKLVVGTEPIPWYYVTKSISH